VAERLTLPMYNYFDSFANAMPWPNAQRHASRGCPLKCIFCVWPQMVYDGQQYRTRDNADIVAEMEWLLDQYGFQAIYFDDDTFNIDNERIIDLCDRIGASPTINVPLCAMGRADTSSQEAFEAMKRAGLVGRKFGVETGDVEMMTRIKKHLDLGRVKTTVETCRELAIGVHLTFSFGGLGETHESAQRTIDLALELNPDTVQVSLVTPFPGTAMFEQAIAKGTLLTTDWSQFDGARYTVVKGEDLSHVAGCRHRVVGAPPADPAPRPPARVGHEILAFVRIGLQVVQVRPVDRSAVSVRVARQLPLAAPHHRVTFAVAVPPQTQVDLADDHRLGAVVRRRPGLVVVVGMLQPARSSSVGSNEPRLTGVSTTPCGMPGPASSSGTLAETS